MSSPKFHTLTLKDVRKETSDCISVAFNIPDNLSSDYAYLQGQYITMHKQIDGEEVRRSYSVCSSPLDG